jgi:hypothetical protein
MLVRRGGNMKIPALLGGLVLGSSLLAGAPTCTVIDHEHWARASLRQIESVKVGMKRVDVEKIFTTIGGLSTVTQRTYAYRDCPYFMVDVRFSQASSGGGEDPNDTIVAISRPYLAWPTAD